MANPGRDSCISFFGELLGTLRSLCMFLFNELLRKRRDFRISFFGELLRRRDFRISFFGEFLRRRDFRISFFSELLRTLKSLRMFLPNELFRTRRSTTFYRRLENSCANTAPCNRRSITIYTYLHTYAVLPLLPFPPQLSLTHMPTRV